MSDTKRACLRRALESCKVFKRVLPMNSWMSSRRNGCLLVSPLLSVYSPGRRREKKARIIMLAMALHNGDAKLEWEFCVMQRMTC